MILTWSLIQLMWPEPIPLQLDLSYQCSIHAIESGEVVRSQAGFCPTEVPLVVQGGMLGRTVKSTETGLLYGPWYPVYSLQPLMERCIYGRHPAF